MTDTPPTLADEINAATAEVVAAHQALADADAAFGAATAAQIAAGDTQATARSRRDAAVAAMTALLARA